MNQTAFEVAQNNKSLSSLLELDENYLDGPNAKGVINLAQRNKKLRNGLKKQHPQQQQQKFYNSYYGQQTTNQTQYSNQNQQSQAGLQNLPNSTSMTQLAKLQLQKKIVGVTDLYKEQRELDSFLTNYSNNTTIAAKSRNFQQSQNIMLAQSQSLDNRKQKSNVNQNGMASSGNLNVLSNQQLHYNSNMNSDLSTLHPQIAITNQLLSRQQQQNDGNITLPATANQFYRSSLAVETPKDGAKSGQYLFDNLRAKSQNNTISSKGADKYIKNGKIVKMAYQTANAFNENRYKYNKSQLAGSQTSVPSNRVASTSYSKQKPGNRLRFLMEENVLFQQESDAKIDHCIQQALKQEQKLESKDFLKLQKIIEDLNSKIVGDQTKFEMRFNLDLVFGGDKDIQKFNEQKQETIQEQANTDIIQAALDHNENQTHQIQNNEDQSKFQYQLNSSKELQQVTSNQNPDLIDKIYNNLQVSDQEFSNHAYEVQKLFRVLFRQINNPYLNQILQAISVWMILWIEQIEKHCENKVEVVKEQSKDKSYLLELNLEKRWKDLEENVKSELVKKEQEIEKMKVSLERLIRDKERVEDTLRHRDSELQMLNRNPDYDMLKGMLDELATYLDECDERTLELNPQIESIKNISQLVQQLEDEKKLDDIRKASEVKMIKIRRRKIKSEKSKENQMKEQQAKEQRQEPIIQDRVVVRVQKVYERTPTADQAIIQPLIQPIEQVVPLKPLTSQTDLRNRKDTGVGTNFICTRCGRSESESKLLIQQNKQNTHKEKPEKLITPIKEQPSRSYGPKQEFGTQTQLTLIKEPYASIADQMFSNVQNKRRGTIVNNRKVLIMPKEMMDNQGKQGNQNLHRSLNLGQPSSTANQNLGDPSILKLVETAMEEMVRFEMSEQSQYSQSTQQQQYNQINQVKKIFEFKEYMFDYLLTQYGLRNIAQKNYDQIIQRIYWYAEKDNQYAQQMMNALGTPYPINKRVWSINKQHVCIFAKILYTDSFNLTKTSSFKGDVSPARRVSRIDINLVGDAFNSGGNVNIFDLIELMSKYVSHHDSSSNPMIVKLLSNIKPGPLIDDDCSSIDTEFENESLFLELAQMKITAKMAKFGFDHKYFLETIDYKDKGRLKFDRVIQCFTERFSLYFSNAEITALRRYFFNFGGNNNQQQQNNNNSNKKNEIQVNMQNMYVLIRDAPRSLATLLFTQQEFMSKIRLYLISKSQFIQFVLDEYDNYMEQLSDDIQILFKKYDDFYKRGGINLQQFSHLIKDDLNLMGIGNINCSVNDDMQIEKLFNDALEFLEDSDKLKSQQLLGLMAVKEIIMERNLESLPFYSYMRNKFNAGKQFIKKSTQKQQQMIGVALGSNSNIMGSENNSPLNRSLSPMRRGTLRLKRI
eukprot:403341631